MDHRDGGLLATEGLDLTWGNGGGNVSRDGGGDARTGGISFRMARFCRRLGFAVRDPVLRVTGVVVTRQCTTSGSQRNSTQRVRTELAAIFAGERRVNTKQARL